MTLDRERLCAAPVASCLVGFHGVEELLNFQWLPFLTMPRFAWNYRTRVKLYCRSGDGEPTRASTWRSLYPEIRVR